MAWSCSCRMRRCICSGCPNQTGPQGDHSSIKGSTQAALTANCTKDSNHPGLPGTPPVWPAPQPGVEHNLGVSPNWESLAVILRGTSYPQIWSPLTITIPYRSISKIQKIPAIPKSRSISCATGLCALCITRSMWSKLAILVVCTSRFM